VRLTPTAEGFHAESPVAKRRLLIVDADSRSVRVLEANLTKAGHDVATAADGEEALATLEWWLPDLVLSETRLPKVDGYEMARRIRERPEWESVAFAFLTRDRSVEQRIRGLELGIEDYLTKPIFIGELVARVNLLLARRAPSSSGPPRASRPSLPPFGAATDATMLDLLKSLEVSGKSGVVRVRNGHQEASIYVRQGKVVDAEAGRLRGENAVYRALIWDRSAFHVELAPVDRPDAVSCTTQALLVEAMRRVDEWSRLCNQVLPLPTVLILDEARLRDSARTMAAEVGEVLRLVDGQRSIAQIVEESPFDDVATLAIVARCCAERVLLPRPEAREEPVASAPPSSLTVPISRSASELLKSWPPLVRRH